MTEELRAYSVTGDDGIILISIILFALFALAISRGRMALIHNWTIFFTNRKASGGEQVASAGEVIRNNVLLICIMSASVGLLYFCLTSLHADKSSLGVLFSVTGLILLYILAKLIAYNVINWAFFEWDAKAKWDTAYLFILACTAFAFFPLALAKIYLQLSDQLTLICAVSILIIYKILLFCKLYIIFKCKNYGFLLLFLYFCTLEILPVLIGWQIVD
ncbi:MAG: DUF4271 domain-containing protein [Bacteroidaceae bacterium]|nr:DUF4271 domain-containing protein [Bacteroidaceae bacterium]